MRIKLTKNIYQNKFLIKSYFIGMLWFIYNQYCERRITSIQQKFIPKMNRKHPYYDKDFSSLEDQIEVLSDIWKKFSMLQHKMMKLHHIDHFHFIQPNQYVLHSKKFSQEEKDNFFDDNSSEWINTGYSVLITKANQLKKIGYKIYILTDIFKTETRTVYRDTCCHLNYRGHEILEDAIVKTIVKYYHGK